MQEYTKAATINASHPVRVRGLKLEPEGHIRVTRLSHPVRVRGLKHEPVGSAEGRAASHPVRVRGLKSSDGDSTIHPRALADSTAGAHHRECRLRSVIAKSKPSRSSGGETVMHRETARPRPNEYRLRCSRIRFAPRHHPGNVWFHISWLVPSMVTQKAHAR
jgi:hypothetical protein